METPTTFGSVGEGGEGAKKFDELADVDHVPPVDLHQYPLESVFRVPCSAVIVPVPVYELFC